MERLFSLSKYVNGASMITMSEESYIARAIDTRCRCPSDSSFPFIFLKHTLEQLLHFRILSLVQLFPLLIWIVKRIWFQSIHAEQLFPL